MSLAWLRRRPLLPEADAPQTPARIVLGRLARNKSALLGAGVLAVLYLAALLAGFLSPYDPRRTHATTPDHPPHRLHFFDQQGQFHLRPFVYRYELQDKLLRTYTLDPSHRYPLRFFVPGHPYKLWWMIPMQTHLIGLEGGEQDGVWLYLMGSDVFGRDLLSRVLHGAQISLSVGLIGIFITMSLGLLVGGVSGYFGGWVDTALMRLVELLMSIPGLYLILALRSGISQSPLMRWVFGLEPGQRLDSGQTYLLIVAILGLVGWGGTARVIRGIVLSIKQIDYVRAARALGAGHLRVIVRHILPNTLTYVIVAATLSVPAYILGEVSLSFLGVGIEDPTPSWGLMLQDAQNPRAIIHAPWLLLPGLFIFLTVFAYNFLGDGLRDALDPKSVD